MTRSLRIVHVLPLIDPVYGGPVHAALALAGAQLEAGHRVEVLTTDRSFLSSARYAHDETTTPVPVRQLAVKAPVRWSRTPALAAELRSLDPTPDVLHIHTVFHHSSNLAARVARSVGITHVIEPHGSFTRVSLTHGTRHKFAYRLVLDDRMCRRASGVRCASSAERDDLAAIGLAANAFVVPHGVDALPPGGAPARRGGPVVLFLGRLASKKRLDVTIDAFARTLKIVPDARLRIVGEDEDGLAAMVAERATRLDIADSVELVGPRFGEQRAAELRGADVFVLLSDDESFGMAPLEALCAGVPVVATPAVASMQDLAGRAAVRLVPQDAARAGEAIAEVLQAPALGERARQEGPRLTQEFSWESIASQMDERYRAMLAARP